MTYFKFAFVVCLFLLTQFCVAQQGAYKVAYLRFHQGIYTTISYSDGTEENLESKLKDWAVERAKTLARFYNEGWQLSASYNSAVSNNEITFVFIKKE